MKNRYIISKEDLMNLIKNKNAKIDLGKTDTYKEDAILELE